MTPEEVQRADYNAAQAVAAMRQLAAAADKV